jgi:magnesium-transporting ATPase (P-type)
MRNKAKNSPISKKHKEAQEIEELESGLIFLGCVGETKVIRKDSRALIRSFSDAGIGVNIAS